MSGWAVWIVIVGLTAVTVVTRSAFLVLGWANQLLASRP